MSKIKNVETLDITNDLASSMNKLQDKKKTREKRASL